MPEKKKDDLERQLGQLAYQIGKKQEQIRVLNFELQQLQGQANTVATQIEKIDGGRDNP